MPSWVTNRVAVASVHHEPSPWHLSAPAAEQPPPPYAPESATCSDHGEENHSKDTPLVLIQLPPAILRRIQSLLPPESQLALAFVNKNLFSLLIPTPIKPERKLFFRLLDRDLSVLVYCSLCDGLHGPFFAIGRECSRFIVLEDERPPGSWGYGTFRYTIPEFNFIHALMRSYRAGRRDYIELPSAGIGAGRAYRREAEMHFCRGVFVERERIVPAQAQNRPASLVWMMQRVFPVTIPCSTRNDQGGKIDTVRNLYEIGCYVRWAPRICDHRRWNTEYPFLLTNAPDLKASSQKTRKGSFWTRQKIVDLKTAFQDFAVDPEHFHGPAGDEVVTGTMDARLRCALHHHHGPHHPCPDSTQFGFVRSCDRCDTDFTFTVVTEEVRVGGEKETKRQENLLVFTAWKNMGPGIDREEDLVWQAHISGTKNSSDLARSTDFLWPYTQYGKLEGSPGEYGHHVYKPRLLRGTILTARSNWEKQKSL
ncbi:hypothetical protein V8F20_010316 [Naviculisporaceae sp. PSN 640]